MRNIYTSRAANGSYLNLRGGSVWTRRVPIPVSGAGAGVLLSPGLGAVVSHDFYLKNLKHGLSNLSIGGGVRKPKRKFVSL